MTERGSLYRNHRNVFLLRLYLDEFIKDKDIYHLYV